MTQREENIAACLRHGFREVKIRSLKYICYYDHTNGRYYFLGKAGAIRSNKVPHIKGSVSIRFSEKFFF